MRIYIGRMTNLIDARRRLRVDRDRAAAADVPSRGQRGAGRRLPHVALASFDPIWSEGCTLTPAMSQPFVPDKNAAIVRYQVAELDRSVAFYTRHLDFALVFRAGPIATIKRGELYMLLSAPGASGGRPMPDGARQEPGGWNRIVLYVDDLAASMAVLETAGVRFRNAVESGPGGKQILLDDPDGNPIELHEAPAT
jgi:glyoxylase I family protein